MKKAEAPVIVEDSFVAPIEKVWKAITNLNEMKLWYFENIDSFKAEVGGKSKILTIQYQRLKAKVAKKDGSILFASAW